MPLWAVILPMVLQVRETMVLQVVVRRGKEKPPHFCVFSLPVGIDFSKRAIVRIS